MQQASKKAMEAAKQTRKEKVSYQANDLAQQAQDGDMSVIWEVGKQLKYKKQIQNWQFLLSETLMAKSSQQNKKVEAWSKAFSHEFAYQTQVCRWAQVADTLTNRPATLHKSTNLIHLSQS